MKRIISLLLVVVVVLGCIGFIACGGGGGNGGAPPANGGTTPADGENGGATPPPDEDGATPPEETLADILGRGAAITAVKWDSVVTAPGADTTTIHCWLEQDKMRTEITEQGETIITLVDFGAQVSYLYMPDQNMAIQLPFDPGAAESTLAESQSIPDYDYEIIDTEILDGKECLVVEYTVEQATVKTWIWKERGFPIRIETTTSEGTNIVECKNIEFGDIPDSMFELPPGVTIMGS